MFNFSKYILIYSTVWLTSRNQLESYTVGWVDVGTRTKVRRNALYEKKENRKNKAF
jgi:hypothetical protein